MQQSNLWPILRYSEQVWWAWPALGIFGKQATMWPSLSAKLLLACKPHLPMVGRYPSRTQPRGRIRARRWKRLNGCFVKMHRCSTACELIKRSWNGQCSFYKNAAQNKPMPIWYRWCVWACTHAKHCSSCVLILVLITSSKRAVSCIFIPTKLSLMLPSRQPSVCKSSAVSVMW